MLISSFINAIRQNWPLNSGCVINIPRFDGQILKTWYIRNKMKLIINPKIVIFSLLFFPRDENYCFYGERQTLAKLQNDLFKLQLRKIRDRNETFTCCACSYSSLTRLSMQVLVSKNVFLKTTSRRSLWQQPTKFAQIRSNMLITSRTENWEKKIIPSYLTLYCI